MRCGPLAIDRARARIACSPCGTQLAQVSMALRAVAAIVSAAEVLRPPERVVLVDDAADADVAVAGAQDVRAMPGASHPDLHDARGGRVADDDVLAEPASGVARGTDAVDPAVVGHDLIGRHKDGVQARRPHELPVREQGSPGGIAARLI